MSQHPARHRQVARAGEVTFKSRTHGDQRRRAVAAIEKTSFERRFGRREIWIGHEMPFAEDGGVGCCRVPVGRCVLQVSLRLVRGPTYVDIRQILSLS